jgi:predicted DNA-binding antitoxin AbrB/MazE fold protein
MTIENETIIEGIYQNGVITPLEPLNLPDKAIVKIHIAAQAQRPKGSLTKYKGILSGQGDFSLTDIRKIVGATTDAHLDKLVEKLEADGE